MDNFSELSRRLRARIERSANRENSLDWKAADAIDKLQARNLVLEDECEQLKADEERVENHASQMTNSIPEARPETTTEVPNHLANALTLKEAAQLLRVSYGTIYTHKVELGFFQVGNQWRVWPDKLKTLGQQTPRANAPEKVPPLPPERVEPHRSPSMSATRAAAEFAKVLSELRPAKARLKRNTAKRPKRP